MKEINEIKLFEIKDWLVKDLDEDIFEVIDSHITYEKSVDTFKVGDLEKLPKDMKSFIQGMILGYEIGATGACEHLDIKVIDDTTIVKATPQSDGVVEEAKGGNGNYRRLMKGFGKKEDIIDFDFQGWPVYKMNIRSILKSLGFECEGGKWVIDDADPTLDIYPCVLEDDAPEVDEPQPNHIEYKYDIDYLLSQTSERSLIDSLLDYMSVSDIDEWLRNFMQCCGKYLCHDFDNETRMLDELIGFCLKLDSVRVYRGK